MSTFVSPPPEDKVEHVRLLLELADDPTHVATTMDGPTGLAFIVPDELGTRYLAALYDRRKAAEAADKAETSADDAEVGQEQLDVAEDTGDESPEVQADETTTPKRRGRPPGSKNKATTDSTDQGA
jgi:hypothetical protein